MFKLLAMGLAIIVLNGCGGVHFYSDNDLKVRTGLRYYTAKPYVLVARVGGNTKPVEVSIVYLPDLAKPQYAKHVKGFGKNNFKFVMENSILTDVGIDTDQNLSDVVNAIATVFKTMKAKDFKEAPPISFELYEIDMENKTVQPVKLINLKVETTVAFALASSSVAEAAGSQDVDVVLTTTHTLTAPISVDVVDLRSGTDATPADYTYASPTTVTFPIGATNGATLPVTVTINNDSLMENTEDLDLQLTNVVGTAALGAQIDHRVDITDDDAAA